MSPQTIREKAALRLPPEEGPEFQIAPMIDILLVMLVFFMSISSTEIMEKNKDIVLPVARGVSKWDRDVGQTIVNVTWTAIDNTGTIESEGRLFTASSQVRDYLRLKAQHSPGMRVLIRADRDVRYDYLRPLMTAISQAGVGKISFAVVDRNPYPNPASIH